MGKIVSKSKFKIKISTFVSTIVGEKPGLFSNSSRTKLPNVELESNRTSGVELEPSRVYSSLNIELLKQIVPKFTFLADFVQFFFRNSPPPEKKDYDTMK